MEVPRLKPMPMAYKIASFLLMDVRVSSGLRPMSCSAWILAGFWSVDIEFDLIYTASIKP